MRKGEAILVTILTVVVLPILGAVVDRYTDFAISSSVGYDDNNTKCVRVCKAYPEIITEVP